jgi:hypothetical protein
MARHVLSVAKERTGAVAVWAALESAVQVGRGLEGNRQAEMANPTTCRDSLQATRCNGERALHALPCAAPDASCFMAMHGCRSDLADRVNILHAATSWHALRAAFPMQALACRFPHTCDIHCYVTEMTLRANLQTASAGSKPSQLPIAPYLCCTFGSECCAWRLVHVKPSSNYSA